MRSIIGVMLMVVLVAPAVGRGTLQNEKALDFTLKTSSNRKVRLKDYRGKVLLLNFWATWCVPCTKEIPELVKWQQKYEGKGLRIIGITYPPYKAASVNRLAGSLAINYPIVFDNKKIAGRYSVGEILPVTIIVDRQGMIAGRILGIIEQEEFDQKVKPLIE